MKKSELGSVELKKFIAGGLAGCCAKGVVSPLDRIKIFRQGIFCFENLKFPDFSGEHSLYGNMSVFRTGAAIIRNEGLSQLWRGLPSLVIRIFPYAGLQFWTNDFYRSKWKRGNYQSWRQIGGMNVPVQNLACGSMAGVTATSITYPLDTIRTRMLYTSKTSDEYRTFRNTVSTLYRSPGGIR